MPTKLVYFLLQNVFYTNKFYYVLVFYVYNRFIVVSTLILYVYYLIKFNHVIKPKVSKG